MKLSLDIKTTLSQTLTPQQIQYLKLLQLPQIQLEQYVMQEIEQNPMLDSPEPEAPVVDELQQSEDYSSKEEIYSDYEGNPDKVLIDDNPEPFEFYKMVAQYDNDYSGLQGRTIDNDEGETYQIKDDVTFYDNLIQQLRLLPLDDEEYLLGEQIIGNVDDDGYLRRDLIEIVDDTNIVIAELNLDNKQKMDRLEREARGETYNPARNYAVNPEVLNILRSHNQTESPATEIKAESPSLKEVNLEQATRVLNLIQHLDPPGIASRTVQECLIAQCRSLPKKSAAQKLALEILENAYEAFSMKHFHIIKKKFEVTDDYLREAFELIRHLNPKPGGGTMENYYQSVIPDFTIERAPDSDELLITVNDSRLPVIKLSDAYKKVKKEAKYKLFNKETKDWIRSKYEDAKFLIQAIRQRKNTMLKVMTAIAGMQREYFDKGPSALKPLIYKNIAETTGLDISTVCRIVNGKYVQTEFGTFELKSFFSEALPNADGEDISTTVIKQVVKEIIDSESKKRPFSDDKISEELKKHGYNVARRTVAKYREQLKIPVARLRKEI